METLEMVNTSSAAREMIAGAVEDMNEDEIRQAIEILSRFRQDVYEREFEDMHVRSGHLQSMRIT